MNWAPQVGDVVWAEDYTGEHHVAILVKVVTLSSGAVGFRVRFPVGGHRTFTTVQNNDIILVARANPMEEE